MIRTTLKTALPLVLAVSIGAGAASAMTSASGYKSDTPPVTVTEQNSFETFSEMIEIAGLTTSLIAPDTVTIFAPTDAAFDELTKEQKASLLAPENKVDLAKFLTNHMVIGLSNPKQKGQPMVVDSMGDAQLAIDLDGGFTVNGTRVIDQGIQTEFGIVHVIEEPLAPLL